MKTKQERMREMLQKARDIAAKAEEEKRDFTGEERAKVAEMLEGARDLKAQIKAAKKDSELRADIEAFSEMFEDGKGEEVVKHGKGRTIGERFVNSPEFKKWMGSVAPNGHIPERAKGIMSPPVQFKTLRQKDLVVGDDNTSAGAFVETDYTGIYEPLGRYSLNALDLINRRTTQSDLVEFVRQTTRVSEADVIAESDVTDASDAGQGDDDGEKPEGTVEFEKVTAAVKNIAVWIPATKRALSDAAQIRGIIDQELQDDLNEELEDQILNGDGTGENFTGILETSGILAQAWDTDILTTTRKAVTTVQVTGRATPTAWLLHPEDWETVELEQDDNGRYYYAGPQAQGPQPLWGLPVVPCQSLTQGTGLLGDFRKAILWDREEASIQVSDSHSDFFIRNMVAILAEMRAAFGLIRPSAFVEVDLEAGS